MAETTEADWLSEIAVKARADASRARELRRVLEILTKHETGAVLSFATDFMRESESWHADAEVAITIKQMWRSIREETLRRVAAELDEIVNRYQPLVREAAS